MVLQLLGFQGGKALGLSSLGGELGLLGRREVGQPWLLQMLALCPCVQQKVRHHRYRRDGGNSMQGAAWFSRGAQPVSAWADPEGYNVSVIFHNVAGAG